MQRLKTGATSPMRWNRGQALLFSSQSKGTKTESAQEIQEINVRENKLIEATDVKGGVGWTWLQSKSS